MPLLDEVVAQEPARVAGRPALLPDDIVDARSDGLVAVGLQDLLLGRGMDHRLLGGPEPRAHQHPIGTERQGSDKTATVGDPASGDQQGFRRRAGKQVSHGRKEGHGGACMKAVPARLGALGDEDGGTRIQGAPGVLQRVDLADQRHCGLVHAGRERAGIGEGKHHRGGSALQGEVEQRRVLRHRPGDEAAPDPLVPGACEFALQMLAVAVASANQAKAATGRHGRCERSARSRIHRREDDRVPDAEHLRQAGLNCHEPGTSVADAGRGHSPI